MSKEHQAESLAKENLFCSMCGQNMEKGKNPHMIIDQYNPSVFRLKCIKKDRTYTIYVR
jgi:hypothetical protein